MPFYRPCWAGRETSTSVIADKHTRITLNSTTCDIVLLFSNMPFSALRYLIVISDLFPLWSWIYVDFMFRGRRFSNSSASSLFCRVRGEYHMIGCCAMCDRYVILGSAKAFGLSGNSRNVSQKLRNTSCVFSKHIFNFCDCANHWVMEFITITPILPT